MASMIPPLRQSKTLSKKREEFNQEAQYGVAQTAGKPYEMGHARGL